MKPAPATTPVVVHLEIDSVDIDVTDLFLFDFAITEELVNVLQALIVKEKTTSSRGRLAEAKQSLYKVLDMMAGRTIEVGRRVAAAARDSDATHDPHLVNFPLGRSLSRSELLGLRVPKNDEFAKMDLDELRAVVGEQRWSEIKMRVAAAQPVEAIYLRRTAQWFLRGLDIGQAVAKACMRSRRNRQ